MGAADATREEAANSPTMIRLNRAHTGFNFPRRNFFPNVHGMKTTLLPVRFIAMMSAMPLVLTSLCVANAQPATTKIGVYESRAVALAYGRSTQHLDSVAKLAATAKKAKADGDEKTYDKLRAKLASRQEQLEYQVFSDRRIDDIIAEIPPALAEVKQKAGVDRIVDKRDAPKDGATVDVTRQLVDQFHPTDKTLKMIDDLVKQPPVKHVPKH